MIHRWPIYGCEEPTKQLLNSGLCWTTTALSLRRSRGTCRSWALLALMSSRATPLKHVTAYQDFLALWKDADSDLPILKQAKEEYAKLQ
jgi:hypothetical protein